MRLRTANITGLLLACLLLAAGCPVDPGSPNPDAAADANIDIDANVDAAISADAIVDANVDANVDAAISADASVPPETDVSLTLRVTVPADTPAAPTIHVAGDFQGWNPADPAFQLTLAADGLYEITISVQPASALAFKFTRGSWPTVEKGPNGEEITDRALTITAPAGGSETHQLHVASWADTEQGTTRTGDIFTLTVPNFLASRRVWIYLPPSYDTSPSTQYPVLYMLDGQNVFDVATSFSGEWEVDESLQTLIAATQVQPLIVVAVNNGGANRLDEYTPWLDPGVGGGGAADAHLNAIINTLVPWVDAHFRTLPTAPNRGFSGSSLGGLMTLYAAYFAPTTFGRHAALSPSIWWDSEHIVSWIAPQSHPGGQIYLDMGTLESGVMVDDDGNGIDDHIDRLRRMRDALVAQGYVLDTDLSVVEDSGATHAEAYWAARFPDALCFLFPPP